MGKYSRPPAPGAAGQSDHDRPSIKFWETRRWGEAGSVSAEGPLRWLIFDRDGRLARADWDKTIELWDIHSKETTEEHQGARGVASTQFPA